MIHITALNTVTDQVIKFIKNFGFVKTVGYITLLSCVVITGFTIEDRVYKAIDKSNNDKEIQHDMAVAKRYENSPVIDKLLYQVMSTYQADRVCVVEMHNGTNNVAGLPFIYGEMTYEVCRDTIHPVGEDYTKFNLSRLTFPMYMLEKGFFCGDMNELAKLDSKFANRLMTNGTTYLCGYTIYGKYGALGYFGVIWCGDKPDNVYEVVNSLNKYTQRLSSLLDK